MGVSRPSSP